MKILIIFDSNFGNTKIIADTIAEELDSRAVAVSDLNREELNDVNLLIVGSPILAWRPSEKIGKFLESLNDKQLKGVKATSFDTRVKMFIHGDAANKIAAGLKKAGAEIIITPQAFYVKGKEGPLFEDETKKAAEWAKEIKLGLSNT